MGKIPLHGVNYTKIISFSNAAFLKRHTLAVTQILYVISLQTQIFLSWNDASILLIILSYRSRKFIEFTARTQEKAKIIDFRKNDPIWPQMTSDRIWHRQCCNHIKLHKYWNFHDSGLCESSKTNKIWPQLTLFDLKVLRPSMHPNLMSNKQIDIKKSLKNGHVWAWKLPKISTL